MNTIKLNVTKEQVDRASELYDFDVLKDSITFGKSNIYGAIGEIIVYDYLTGLGREVDHVGTLHYDMVVNRKTIDVKTKKTSVPPLQRFNCSIAASNTRQECDYYLFVRVHEDKEEAWICGYIEKKEYYEKAKFFRKGQKDPTFPTWKFAADCYNLEISKLKSF